MPLHLAATVVLGVRQGAVGELEVVESDPGVVGGCLLSFEADVEVAGVAADTDLEFLPHPIHHVVQADVAQGGHSECLTHVPGQQNSDSLAYGDALGQQTIKDVLVLQYCSVTAYQSIRLCRHETEKCTWCSCSGNGGR